MICGAFWFLHTLRGSNYKWLCHSDDNSVSSIKLSFRLYFFVALDAEPHNYKKKNPIRQPFNNPEFK